MNSHITRSDPDIGVSVSVVVSAVIHLAVFLLLVWWGQLSPPQMNIQETYYVDVVTLPVAAPQAGHSVQTQAEPAAVSPPVQAMKIPAPAKSAVKPGTKTVKQSVPRDVTETESEFDKGLEKLTGKAEAQQYEERLKRLSSKKTAGKVGAPAATGTEAGSRYADFIKSRLEDALKVTSSYKTKKPEVVMRLTISPEGKVLRTKIERSSGDATFELAVMRAVDLASKQFRPPPNNSVFENGFVFRPKGITNGSSR